MIKIIRHGQSLHNVERGYPYRDPPLTEIGERTTRAIELAEPPDLILVSPMTRTIQTVINAFPTLLHTAAPSPKVQIWPDLREAHDAECNKGLSRADLRSKFPQFDFAECHEQWDYAPNTIENAIARAERVRKRLEELSESYKNIAVITHRGFIAFLVKGMRFDVCEVRSYRFATEEERQIHIFEWGSTAIRYLSKILGLLVSYSTESHDWTGCLEWWSYIHIQQKIAVSPMHEAKAAYVTWECYTYSSPASRKFSIKYIKVKLNCEL